MVFFEKTPTVSEIATGLSTVPRWTARTVLDRVGLRWSVLQHSLVCGAVAHWTGDPILYAHALLHDAEEILTGDIPRPFKTDEQSELGRDIRREILAGLGLPAPTGSMADRLQDIDDRVAVAEAHVLLKPGAAPAAQGKPVEVAIVDQVWGLLDLGVRDAIEIFTDFTAAALKDPRVASLASRV